MNAEQESLIEERMLLWQEAFEQGRDLSAAELCQNCPELLAELQRQIDSQRLLNNLASTAEPTNPDTRAWETKELAALQQPLDEQIGGYRVLGLLGEGGMGRVLRAEDPRLGRHIALKVMRQDLAQDERARQRFLREARAVAALQHDNVVSVYQVGEDNGVPFLAMPLLEGETLASRLERDGCLPVAEVLRVGREAAEGLAAAHAAGLVHRDVKPANLWLEASGRVKVLDFGLARPQVTDHVLTESGVVVGTPAFMSPEQIDGQTVDARGDLFSLGGVLYRAATGRMAFSGKSLTALLRAVAEQQPPAPRELRAELPGPLSDLIVRMLSKDPAARPVSARAVADELKAIAEQPGETMPTTEAYLPGRDRGSRRRWPIAKGVAVAVVVLIVAAACVLWWSLGPEGGSGEGKAGASGDGQGADAQGEPVKVVRLDVEHYARNGEFEDLAGKLGRETFSTRLGDSVTMVGKLSRPAYCYLVAYLPDGTEFLCFPGDARTPPERTDEPRYPQKVGGNHYATEEGEGLMGIVLMVSQPPLPAYAEWKKARGDSPWRKTRAIPFVVWRSNGKVMVGYTPKDPEGRGEQPPATGRAPFDRVLEWLGQAGFDAVEAKAFPVVGKQ